MYLWNVTPWGRPDPCVEGVPGEAEVLEPEATTSETTSEVGAAQIGALRKKLEVTSGMMDGAPEEIVAHRRLLDSERDRPPPAPDDRAAFDPSHP